MITMKYDIIQLSDKYMFFFPYLRKIFYNFLHYDIFFEILLSNNYLIK